MKRICAFVLCALLVLAAAAPSCAGTMNFDVSKIADYFKDEEVFETVTIPSAESYLDGVPPCDNVWVDENCYIYGYIAWGNVYNGYGDNAVWERFEQYVEDIVSTGVFEVVRHDEEDGFERWCLGYSGPGTLPRPFRTGDNPADEAITVVSYEGNVQVWYSRDVQTSDLAETLLRLELVSTPTPKPTAAPGGMGNCEACDGDGVCNNCGGNGWYEGWAWVTNSFTKESESKLVNVICKADNCHGGSCKICGGDGWV